MDGLLITNDPLTVFTTVFEEARERYHLLVKMIEQEGGIYIFYSEIDNVDIQLSGIKALYQENFSEQLKSILKDKLVNSNAGYLNMLNTVFQFQYDFISDFTQCFILYYTDKPYFNRLYNSINSGSGKKMRLQKEELELAIQAFYISEFTEYEDLIKKYWYSYQSKVKPQTPIDLNKNYDNIILNYHPNDSVVLEQVYEALKEKFIEVPFKTFKSHFGYSEHPEEKIKWLGEYTLLVALFAGHDLSELRGLKIRNADYKKVICDHFCKRNSADFKLQDIRNTDQNIAHTIDLRHASLISPLLQKINP